MTDTLDVDGDGGLHERLQALLTALRSRMKARHNRHVGLGDLLADRWQLAREHGFGAGTSAYDSSLVIGDVRVGAHCWIGPGAILDGSGGGLTIGDHVDVGAGAQLYTHQTVHRALTRGRAPVGRLPTAVGDACHIGPNAVIGPGTTLGDHCHVAAGSYVEGTFPSYSFVAGNPASRVGEIVIDGDRVQVRRWGSAG